MLGIHGKNENSSQWPANYQLTYSGNSNQRMSIFPKLDRAAQKEKGAFLPRYLICYRLQISGLQFVTERNQDF